MCWIKMVFHFTKTKILPNLHPIVEATLIVQILFLSLNWQYN